jgi:hypothetical protein
MLSEKGEKLSCSGVGKATCPNLLVPPVIVWLSMCLLPPEEISSGSELLLKKVS